MKGLNFAIIYNYLTERRRLDLLEAFDGFLNEFLGLFFRYLSFQEEFSCAYRKSELKVEVCCPYVY
jgi:hypothetical protein